MIEVTGRSGPARAGAWAANGAKAAFPLVLGLDGGPSVAPNGDVVLDGTVARIPRPAILPPGDWSLAGGNCALASGRAPESVEGELLVMSDAFSLRRDARAFADAVTSYRRAAGPARLLYAPGIMEPANLALLTYCGVDVTDAALAVYQAARGRVLTPDGSLRADEAEWLTGDGILEASLRAVRNELMLVRRMIAADRLRELVELRANASPWAAAALRLMDLEHYEDQERVWPVTGTQFKATSKSSLTRPDIVRFRRRFMERWRPAPHKKALLLIPCSARKPYSQSKSHRMFEEALLSVPNSCAVQELIVTSPLGAVPREWELAYPAAHYDIPTTGHWDYEESSTSMSMIARAASFGFDAVISHLGKECGLVPPGLEVVDTTQGDGVTSPASLERLRDALREACASAEKAPRSVDRAESLRSFARFQFGEAGGALLDGASVAGRGGFLKIMDGNAQRGMLTPDRGMISLTMEGAQTLLDAGMGSVRMGEFKLSGSLFAVGVLDADESIRPGDEAIITRDGALEGVGVAVMPGEEMRVSSRGEAVRVRHKRKS